MEYSASGSEAIPAILISIAVFLIIFTIIPILIVRSVFQSIRSKLPAGASISQLKNAASQIQKSTNWKKIRREWDFEVDPATKAITLKRKADARTLPGGIPTEIRVNSLSELPALFEQLGINKDTPATTAISGKIESKEPASPPPASVSSKITQAKTTSSSPFESPRSYEVVQTIKRVALVLLLGGLYLAFKDFLG